MTETRLIRYAWSVLIFNIAVIVVGAWVRASGSGAGCGASWPTCQGEILPAMEGATAIEYTHRLVSGVALVAVFALIWAVFRARPAGHRARSAAVWSGIAIIGEALIGAVIVLAEWVANDNSVARAVSVPLHLVNTFLLLAGLTLVIFHLGRRVRPREVDGGTLWLIRSAGVVFILIAATGAITALADTLFPKGGAGSAVEAGENFLTDLRIVHPILAVAAAVVALALWSRSGGGLSRRPALIIVALVGGQLVLGFLNVLLGVPMLLRLAHLLLADALWISLIWLAAEVRTEPISAITAEI